MLRECGLPSTKTVITSMDRRRKRIALLGTAGEARQSAARARSQDDEVIHDDTYVFDPSR